MKTNPCCSTTFGTGHALICDNYGKDEAVTRSAEDGWDGPDGPEWALADAIALTGHECCGHNTFDDGTGDARRLLVWLNANGWMLVKVDPFDAPAGTDLTNQRLAELLDTFQEASERYAYEKAGGRLTSVGCCGGWDGPDGPEYCADCPRRGAATNAPAIGEADAEPAARVTLAADFEARVEYLEAIVTGRNGPSVLDTLAERITAIEDKLAGWIPQEQA